MSHRVVQGALRTTGWRRRRRGRRSRFNFPAAVSPPSQSCCRVFSHPLPLGVLSSRSQREREKERQITSGAAAMRPNTAPANTTGTQTHKHTLVHVCPNMLLCGGTKKSLLLTLNSLLMHTGCPGVQDVELFE